VMGIDRSLWQQDTVYLNTATFGLPPQPAWDALQRALDEWRHGTTGFLGWEKSVAGSRRAFSELVGVPEDWVSTSSTVAGMTALVAASIPAGSTVVAPEMEFTSALWPWLVQEQRGVNVRIVPLDSIADAVTDGADLVAVSAVQSSTGRVADLDSIATAAKSVGALTFIDATHACGWMPFRAEAFDFAVCAAYKWLMAPRGTAFMTVRPELLERIPPLAANWFAGEEIHESYYGTPLRLAHSARRLDISPAWFNWVGTQPAIELILDVGVEWIHDHNLGLANRFLAGLDIPAGDSAIVSVDVAAAEDRLRRAGIMVAVRAGSLRASFHLYNTESDVDAALEALTS
jgi:selenocysteine lyase/cysteine desulfurase